LAEYLDLADYLLIAEAVLGVPAETIARWPGIGGHLETSLLCYPASNDPACVLSPPDLTAGAVRAGVLHAAVVAHGKTSSADVSVADFGVNADGQTVRAKVLAANARATCNDGAVSVTAGAQVLDLFANGVKVPVTGGVGQTVMLPGGGLVILNQQTPSTRPDGDRGIKGSRRALQPAEGSRLLPDRERRTPRRRIPAGREHPDARQVLSRS